MRILMIAPEPFLAPRGTPISVYQRLFALSALGHEVDLLTYPYGSQVHLPGVTIHRIPKIPLIKTVKPGPSWAKAVLDILLFVAMVVKLLKRRYDVIHTHEEASFFALVLAPLFGAKHLYDMHSSLPQQLVNYQFGANLVLVKPFKILERLVINSCDALITVGADLETYVRELNPDVRPTTIENLPVQTTANSAPGAASVEDLRQKMGLNGQATVLYTGTFEPYQGLRLLLDSAALVLDELPGAHFVLVGGNPEQVALWRSIAEESGLGDQVHFTGMVPMSEIAEYLELASVVVSPRLGGTTIPLKLYTYLLSGKPVVATRTLAHTQVLNEDIAILTEPEAEEFAQGIKDLLLNPQIGMELAQRARTFAHERYNLADYMNKLDRVYQTLECRHPAVTLSPLNKEK